MESFFHRRARRALLLHRRKSLNTLLRKNRFSYLRLYITGSHLLSKIFVVVFSLNPNKKSTATTIENKSGMIQNCCH